MMKEEFYLTKKKDEITIRSSAAEYPNLCCFCQRSGRQLRNAFFIIFKLSLLLDLRSIMKEQYDSVNGQDGL